MNEIQLSNTKAVFQLPNFHFPLSEMTPSHSTIISALYELTAWGYLHKILPF